ncbi:MAG: hypothetical protein ACK5MV_00705 [Aminipila sp.]
MGKIKDILYDTSDILTAIVIVGIASIIIWFSIGNIMEYPSIIAAQQEKDNSNFGLAVPVGDSTSGSAVTTEDGKTTNGAVSQNEMYSIYINYGESMSSIAQKFVTVGLFESVDQFNTLITQMNAASSIKAGNFIIPSDSTPEEVIVAITSSPGL